MEFAISVAPREWGTQLSTEELTHELRQVFVARGFRVGFFEVEHEGTNDLMGYLSLEGRVDELAKDVETHDPAKATMQAFGVTVYIHGTRH